MSVSEMNVYPIGPKSELDIDIYDNYSIHCYCDYVFKKSTAKNMNKLWAHFHYNDNYPDYYLGIAKKLAICKCPITCIEEWYNADRYLNVENPVKGSNITVYYKVQNTMYARDFIFMGWVKQTVHEWAMKKGTILQLEQSFVNGLSSEDRRYLRMYA